MSLSCVIFPDVAELLCIRHGEWCPMECKIVSLEVAITQGGPTIQAGPAGTILHLFLLRRCYAAGTAVRVYITNSPPLTERQATQCLAHAAMKEDYLLHPIVSERSPLKQILWRLCIIIVPQRSMQRRCPYVKEGLCVTTTDPRGTALWKSEC